VAARDLGQVAGGEPLSLERPEDEEAVNDALHVPDRDLIRSRPGGGQPASDQKESESRRGPKAGPRLAERLSSAQLFPSSCQLFSLTSTPCFFAAVLIRFHAASRSAFVTPSTW